MSLCFIDANGNTLANADSEVYIPLGSDIEVNQTGAKWRVISHSYRLVEARGGYMVDFVRVRVVRKGRDE